MLLLVSTVMGVVMVSCENPAGVFVALFSSQQLQLSHPHHWDQPHHVPITQEGMLLLLQFSRLQTVCSATRYSLPQLLLGSAAGSKMVRGVQLQLWEIEEG